MTMRAVWYVCRYGHQDYEKVMRWSVRAIMRGAEHLHEFIKDENPTKGTGA